MHLGGWKVVHKADGGETDYKFHNSVKLGAGEVATVSESPRQSVIVIRYHCVTPCSCLYLVL